MAHLLDFSNDRVNMAYVGRRPWRGLGNELGVDTPLETWRVEAGLAFDYRLSPVRFFVEDDDPASYLGAPATMPNNFVVYRSDTRAPLAVVSNRYHPVQPGQILEFFRELIAQHGFTMETAGSLKGGAVVWALARTGLDLHLGNDVSHQYVLLMTSCDTKLATRATLTAIRVVCWNTLSCALNRAASDLITVRHTQAFDPEDVARNLGLTTRRRAGDDKGQALRHGRQGGHHPHLRRPRPRDRRSAQPARHAGRAEALPRGSQGGSPAIG